jgi:hypothetical protein
LGGEGAQGDPVLRVSIVGLTVERAAAPLAAATRICPDYAFLCKHVAAVLYGVGARLDEKPELLFRLRAVDEKDLLAHLDATTPLSMTGPAAGRILQSDDISALFGIEMADSDTAAAPAIPGREARESDRISSAERRVGARSKTSRCGAKGPVDSQRPHSR